MFYKRTLPILIALLLGLTSGAMAESISERIDDAHRRIERGMRSGQLTRDESRRLREEFSQIRQQERRATRDGRINHRERERLNHELDRLERHISHLKRNDNRR